MDVEKRIKYDIFINAGENIKDQYKNVYVRIDDIFITIMQSDGRQIGYPLCNVMRINMAPNKDGINN